MKEANLGDFAGHVMGDWLDDWVNGKSPPGAETFHAFTKRSIRGVNTALEQDGPTLIVAHGGTYGAIQRAINRADLPDLANCCLVGFNAPENNKDWNYNIAK